MKSIIRICLAFAVMLGIATASMAAELVKNYPARNITKIDADFVFNVHITKGKTDGVKVVYRNKATKVAERTSVSISGNTLMLSYNGKKSTMNDGDVIDVYLSMERIDELDLSGASKVICSENDIFATNKFEAELSGASFATLKIKCREADLEISGASGIKLYGIVGDLEIEASGASKSKVCLKKCSNAKIEASGASKVHLQGEVNGAEYSASGASRINAKAFAAKNVSADASGASKIILHVSERLAWSASVASEIVYYGEPKDMISKNSGGLVKGE